MPMTPTMPTARRQDLDKERPSTRTSSLESQHNSAKYTRYLKAAQGEVGYINRIRDFQPICWQKLAVLKTLGSPPFRPYKITFTKRHTGESSEHLANCNFANLLVCRTNGYHLTALLQLKN